MLKNALYLRLSLADGDLGKNNKDESNSIEHQVEFMRQYEEQGGISFLLIYFTSRHVCYYMSFQEMMKYWNRAKEGGVKHFKYEELDIGFFVPLKQGMILHYLECLQKVLEQKDQ